MVRKRGLEPQSRSLAASSNARRKHENAGHSPTQPGQYQDVADEDDPDIRTQPVVCQTCGAVFPTTKITQGVHKNNTRAEGAKAAPLADMPSELRSVIIQWPELPQHIKDGIKITLQGFLSASRDTKQSYKNEAIFQ